MHSSMPGNRHCKEASAEPEGRGMVLAVEMTAAGAALSPGEPRHQQKFSALQPAGHVPAPWWPMDCSPHSQLATCLPHDDPWMAAHQTQTDWGKERSSLAHRPPSLGLACSFDFIRSEAWPTQGGKALSMSYWLVWSYKSPSAADKVLPKPGHWALTLPVSHKKDKKEGLNNEVFIIRQLGGNAPQPQLTGWIPAAFDQKWWTLAAGRAEPQPTASSLTPNFLGQRALLQNNRGFFDVRPLESITAADPSASQNTVPPSAPWKGPCQRPPGSACVAHLQHLQWLATVEC